MPPKRPRIRRRLHLSRTIFAAGSLLLSLTSLAAADIVIAPANKTGIYDIGQTVQWTVKATGDDADVKEAAYVIKRNGLTEVAHGKVDLSSGAATVESSLDQPGTLLLVLTTKVGEKQTRTLGGAAIAPNDLKPIEAPSDFDAFWAAKIKELSAIPVHAQLEPADSGKPAIDYAKVTMDNIGGTHIYGQIARPKKKGKYPAMLRVQYAGVYGLPKQNVLQYAEQGWLTLNIMAHDLPLDQPPEFYKQAAATTQKNYTSQGAEDRDKSYFLRMYLSCYRAADYLASRDDWDGKTLIVMGASQGGQLTLVTAGLHPKITAALADVPAGCDANGQANGRATGFPYWAGTARHTHNPAVLEVARYFDAANFAARIKCPTLIATGLIDETCPPAGVITAANGMTAPHTLLLMPEADHTGRQQKGSHNVFYKNTSHWLEAAKAGKPLPPK
jgi:cephalosporin-C deacetylase-like acetyl esterase